MERTSRPPVERETSTPDAVSSLTPLRCSSTVGPLEFGGGSCIVFVFLFCGLLSVRMLLATTTAKIHNRWTFERGWLRPPKNPQTSSATAITRFTRQSVGNDVTPHFGWPSSDLVRIATTTSSCFCRERDLSVSNLQLSVPTLCRSERHRTFCCANVRSACQSVRQ